ncbi:hypothetical protein KLPMMM105M1_00385 [Klebsiella pneumoniae]
MQHCGAAGAFFGVKLGNNFIVHFAKRLSNIIRHYRHRLRVSRRAEPEWQVEPHKCTRPVFSSQQVFNC